MTTLPLNSFNFRRPRTWKKFEKLTQWLRVRQFFFNCDGLMRISGSELLDLTHGRPRIRLIFLMQTG